MFNRGEGGTQQTNITSICGECSQCLSHTRFAPAHGVCAFPVYTAQALGCSARNCLMLALGCMHSTGLSHSGSGSQVLHKGTDLVGPAFCPLPRYEQFRRPGAWQAHSPQVASASYHFPHPSCLVFWVYNGLTFSGVLCVSSGELISCCNPPGRCQLSRITGSLG